MIPRRVSLYGTFGRCVGRDWAVEEVLTSFDRLKYQGS
jgi:hypothetical protein